jgi:hypothetical protein
VKGICILAREYGLQYAWIDTCCIDKSSSAELSEAINSMFAWYRKAAVCCVYFSDVDMSIEEEPQLEQSRWFGRGWTLQELIAPRKLDFFDCNWNQIGSKSDLKELLYRVTNIDPAVLDGGDVSAVSVGRRMSWASSRKTKRAEDGAYCLLGLFDVNMPLLYGERDKAFVRLQEEVLKHSNDSSILAWQFDSVVQCEAKLQEYRSLDDWSDEKRLPLCHKPSTIQGLRNFEVPN